MFTERHRLLVATLVSETTTVIEAALEKDKQALAQNLAETQYIQLMDVLAEDGYLFYPGHTDLTQGPALARRYATEHVSEIDEVSNQE